MIDYQDELNESVIYYKSVMPIEIKKAINNLNTDLYFSVDSVDDEDYHGFESTMNMVADWLEDNIEDRKLSYITFDEDDNEIEEDAGVIESKDICKVLLGNELYNTIY